MSVDALVELLAAVANVEVAHLALGLRPQLVNGEVLAEQAMRREQAS